MRTLPPLPSVRPSHLPQECLARLRDLLVAEAGAQAAQYAAHQGIVAHLRGATDTDSVLERELAEAGAARARETMADVGHALERLDKGTYGWCEACGVPVPLERLEAIPGARLCVACPAGRAGMSRRP